MKEMLKNDWQEALAGEFAQPYYGELESFLQQEYAAAQVFPPQDDIFNALNYTALANVKVLLLGQDPYHDERQAHGLSFSVLPGEKLPPSLQNIYKELKDDLGCPIPTHGYLKKWAEQGVLLLNTVLTVRAHQAHSHKNKGWERFTDAVIRKINEQERPIVILLWGNPAQKKKAMLTNERHLVLTAPHPSPLSSYRGFFGSKPFSQANAFLETNGVKGVDWEL